MKEDIIQQRLATEEEKQKLFDAIKSNGYRWNSETKTLEKLPKFKVGDKITNGKTTIKICHIDNEYYYGMGRNIAYRLYIKNQDDWELVPVLKFKVGDRIIDKLGTHTPTLIKSVSDEYYGLEYPNGIGVMSVKDQDDWELVPNKFDITTLKPFDKVLVRDFDNGIWEIDFFSRLLDGKYFKCLDMSYIQCIPYEANKELLGTTNDCDDFYKTWEN